MYFQAVKRLVKYLETIYIKYIRQKFFNQEIVL